MRKVLAISIILLFLFFGGWTYHIYTKNEELTDPSFVYNHYLKTYESLHYELVAVQYSLKPGFIVQWEPHWRIYLYRNHKLVELEITYENKKVRNYSTVLNYSRISMPLESLQSLELPARDYSIHIYVPTGKRLVEYPAGCTELSKVLNNGTIKLMNSTFGEGVPGLELIEMEPIGGLLAFHYYHDCNCSGTWVVIKPHNETHDSVTVVYPWGKAESYSPALKLQPFSGVHYLKLAEKLENRHCGFLGGIVVNATGIYVNPDPLKNFQKVLEDARKKRKRFIIPTITIYANGTVKEGGIGIMWPSYGSG